MYPYTTQKNLLSSVITGVVVAVTTVMELISASVVPLTPHGGIIVSTELLVVVVMVIFGTPVNTIVCGELAKSLFPVTSTCFVVSAMAVAVKVV